MSPTTKTQVPQILLGQNNPPASASFSTESCFWWLHRKNTAFSMNLRGMVNHEYNRLLTEKGLVSNLIPGGEDFNQLGMDRKTPIVRPDLYFAACHKVISVHTGTLFDGLNLSTDTFFDLLHEQNVKSSANVRGLINQRYNQLLSEAGINEGKIPGNTPEELGMDKNTSLRAEFYAKAYGQVIAQFELPTWDNSDCVPFKTTDIFRHTVQFMRYGDIFHCAQVCKVWNASSKRLNWQQFFKNEGIPLVEEGKDSNYKEEFRVLYPMTISRRMSERLFGNFCEEIPCISRAMFNKCYQEDPFESGKLMMHTFKFVVIPAFFERTSCEEFPFILDQRGALRLVEPGKWTGEKLKISNEVRNLKILCEHPLAGKENMPVFRCFLPAASHISNTYSGKISTRFMRTCVANATIGMLYHEQNTLVNDQGFEIPSLRDRIFLVGVHLLTFGTFPDIEKITVTFDAIYFVGKSYLTCVGGAYHGVRLSCTGTPDRLTGIAPVAYAEDRW